MELVVWRGAVVDELFVGVATGEAALFGGEFEGFLAVELGWMHQFFDTRGKSLRGVGVTRGVRVRCGADQQSNLSFGRPLFQRLQHFRQNFAAKFLVQLGAFTRQASGAVAENFEGVGDGFGDAVRRFVKNQSAIFDAEMLKRATALSAAWRQKSEEEKF